MNKPRRVTRPLSLGGLRGFEAVARLSGFSRAAAELHLTQSAVSRQIQTLEGELGFALFSRGTRSLALLPDGRELLVAVRNGLDGIDAAVARIRSRARDAVKTVNVTTYASFASMWLLPRLPAFSAAHPDVDVRIIASDAYIDLVDEGCDIAIRHGAQRRLPQDAEELFRDQVFPVCSPALLERLPIRAVADLRDHVLLRFEHSAASNDALTWEAWFAANRLAPVRPKSSVSFTYLDQMVQAALRGQGVAIARVPLVTDLMREGDLVAPFGRLKVAGYPHFLLINPQTRHREEVSAFCAWLREAAAVARAQIGALARRQLARARPAAPDSRRPTARRR
ncbi:MAG: LysR family transcriptional regulator [Burkholderiales bacterium]|nr:LysR family transcriptional regulator [Burkholderiales bacterium]